MATGAVRPVAAVVVVALAATASLPAAEILERRVEHRILPDGSVLESTALRVEVSSLEDARRWSSIWVPLDANRELESVDAWVTAPGERERRVKGRLQDRVEMPSADVLHDSRSFHRIALPALDPGAILRVEHSVRVEPWFPSGQIVLALTDPTASLEIRIVGAASLRFSIPDGLGERGLEVEERPDALEVTGSVGASADDGDVEVLRYAWGPRGSWEDVARWYAQLLAEVPRADAAVGGLAAERIASLSTPRETLEALVQVVRREVDYTAVEVGVGGYRPSPPAKTLERRWGDCKDQGLLLIDLLAAAGIPSWPALVRSSVTDEIDPSFASPGAFNHLIVAVDAAAVAAEPDDPVSEGLLFVDSTQTRGGVAWLHPSVQAQSALAVGSPVTGLVRIPDRSELEGRRVALKIDVREDGSASGAIDVTLTGWAASALIDRLDGDDAEAALREEAGRGLGGAALSGFSWGRQEEPVPSVRVVAEARWAVLSRPGADRWSMPVPDEALTPSPRVAVAAALAGRRSLELEIRPPEGWCPELPDPVRESTPGGVFEQGASFEGGTLRLRRDATLGADAARSGDWRDLALLEHRALRRRLRWTSCGAAGAPVRPSGRGGGDPSGQHPGQG